MNDQQFESILKSLLGFIKGVFVFVILLGCVSVYLIKFYDPTDFQTPEREVSRVVEAKPEISREGVHIATGLIADTNFELVVTNCTNCHSAKLITQNRATQEGWISMIEWMQETQSLWDLGENEEKIVAYLAKNYAPGKSSRRTNLEVTEWYELEEE